MIDTVQEIISDNKRYGQPASIVEVACGLEVEKEQSSRFAPLDDAIQTVSNILLDRTDTQSAPVRDEVTVVHCAMNVERRCQ